MLIIDCLDAASSEDDEQEGWSASDNLFCEPSACDCWLLLKADWRFSPLLLCHCPTHLLHCQCASFKSNFRHRSEVTCQRYVREYCWTSDWCSCSFIKLPPVVKVLFSKSLFANVLYACYTQLMIMWFDVGWWTRPLCWCILLPCIGECFILFTFTAFVEDILMHDFSWKISVFMSVWWLVIIYAGVFLLL